MSYDELWALVLQLIAGFITLIVALVELHFKDHPYRSKLEQE
jgi:hypothetical protein